MAGSIKGSKLDWPGLGADALASVEAPTRYKVDVCVGSRGRGTIYCLLQKFMVKLALDVPSQVRLSFLYSSGKFISTTLLALRQVEHTKKHTTRTLVQPRIVNTGGVEGDIVR